MHDQQWNNKADERREEMLGGIGQVRGVYTARPITFNQIRVKK